MSNPSGNDAGHGGYHPNPGQGGYPGSQSSATHWGHTAQYPTSAASASGAGYGQPGQTGVSYGQQPPGYGPQQLGGGATGYAQPGYSQGSSAPKKKKRMVLVLGITIPLLLFAMILGLVVFLTNQDSPDKAVKGYVQALIDGDSRKALTYLDDDPADKTFLTDAVLKDLKANDKGVTKLNSVGKTSTSIQAGGRTRYVDFKPHKVGGKYKVSGLGKLALKTSVDMKTVGVTIPEGEKSYPVFPGVYDMESANENFESTTSLDATDPSYPPFFIENVRVSKTGEKNAREAVKKAISDCMAQKKMAPSGCPYRFRAASGSTIDESTIAVTLPGTNPVDTTPVTSYSSRAELSFNLKTHTEASIKNNTSGESKKAAQDDSWFVSSKVDLKKKPAAVSFGEAYTKTLSG